MKTLIILYDYNILLALKAFLDENNIPYYVRNEQIQSIIFGTPFSGGLNPVAGYYEILVKNEYYEDAKKVLDEFADLYFE